MNVKHKSDLHRQIVLYATDLASSSLRYFKKESKDKRPSQAIRVARAFALKKAGIAEARKAALAAHRAARLVKSSKAIFSARAAGHAAATAHVWTHVFGVIYYIEKITNNINSLNLQS